MRTRFPVILHPLVMVLNGRVSPGLQVRAHHIVSLETLQRGAVRSVRCKQQQIIPSQPHCASLSVDKHVMGERVNMMGSVAVPSPWLLGKILCIEDSGGSSALCLHSQLVFVL